MSESDGRVGEAGLERLGGGAGDAGEVEHASFRAAGRAVRRRPGARGRRAAGSGAASRRASPRGWRAPARTPSWAASMRARRPLTGVRSSCARSATVCLRISSSCSSVSASRFRACATRSQLGVARRLDACLQIALPDPLGGEADPPERPGQRLREEEGEQQRGGDRDGAGDEVEPVERVLEVLFLRREQAVALLGDLDRSRPCARRRRRWLAPSWRPPGRSRSERRPRAPRCEARRALPGAPASPGPRGDQPPSSR